MEILRFIFKSFWHFLGFFMLLGSICTAIGKIGRKTYITKNYYDSDDKNKDKINE